MPFTKGQSGNPAGRPVGSHNKFTREMHEALEEGGPALIVRLLELAGEGNTGAMRQCLDRLMGKQRPSAVALPSPESPTYVLDALTEIHRALGAGEIASDEAARLVDLVGRTARVLASKVVAEIDFAGRLTQCEQALLLLLNAGRPAAAPQTASKEVQEVPAEPAIVNNNTETMAPAEAPAPTATPEPAAIDNNNGITMETAAALDEAVRAALPPRRDSVKDRLMSSVSPAALLLDVDPRKTPPVTTPEAPLSNAA
jgi:Family of unknown function (DUF5681)